MSKSLWPVFLLGVVALALMLVMMWYGLDTWTSGPAGNRIRLARKLHEKFQMESVGVYVVTQAGTPVMRITYTTEQQTQYNGTAQREEILRVVDYAGEEYEGEDREKIEKIHVTRTELVHRACWTGTDMMEETLPNPAYRHPDAPPEFKFNGSNPR